MLILSTKIYARSDFESPGPQEFLPITASFLDSWMVYATMKGSPTQTADAETQVELVSQRRILSAANTKARNTTMRPVQSPCQADPPPGVCPEWGPQSYKRIA